VPAGKRAIVMSVAASNLGSSAGVALVALAGWTVLNPSVPAGGSVLQTGLRLVCYAGEEIAGRPSVGGTAIIVCGYLVDG
jgi:hypothetical protein